MSRFALLFSALVVAGAGACALFACSDKDAAEDCSAVVDRACVPAYDPTFENVFNNTLKPSCALAGSSCHAAAGHKAGLTLDDAETAHRLLLDQRVTPGKPECSLLGRRVLSTDPSFTMPPGLPLAAGERCAIVQWIAQGAKR